MDLQIEKAHLFALKRLLNVSPKTPNDMVYGETGRTPLHLDAKVSSIRFWLRLMRMEAGRLPRKAYNMLANVHNNGRQCWVSAVHGNLMMYGFGYVWANQGVQNVNWFLRVFRERITDCWRQGWDDRIHERDRYSVYRIFKLEHSLEPYFYCVTNKALRDVFIRFRMGISEIKTHKLRYSTLPRDHTAFPRKLRSMMISPAVGLNETVRRSRLLTTRLATGIQRWGLSLIHISEPTRR